MAESSRRLVVFNSISLDGFFAGEHGDIGWAHGGEPDEEWDSYVRGNASGGGTLVFGRVTYEMMASYWPTPYAIETMPKIAEAMNSYRKIVFSRTLDSVTWNNTTLVRTDLFEGIRSLKQEPGPGLVILGSGSLVSQLASARLIDEFQFVVCPTAIGKGRSLFEGLEANLQFSLKQTRAFANGNVLLCYEPKD